MAISAVGDEIRRQRMSRPGQEAGTTAADVSNFVLEESGAGSLVTLPQGDSSEAVREAIAVTLHPMSPLRRVIVQLSPGRAEENTGALESVVPLMVSPFFPGERLVAALHGFRHYGPVRFAIGIPEY